MLASMHPQLRSGTPKASGGLCHCPAIQSANDASVDDVHSARDEAIAFHWTKKPLLLQWEAAALDLTFTLFLGKLCRIKVQKTTASCMLCLNAAAGPGWHGAATFFLASWQVQDSESRL